ncbi:MAG: DNA adenine methylase, partial [Treponema sp.]|nr:DNA adenine methylase [Treponema sp.]
MILKYPGTKTMIASWIVSNFPEDYQNMTYLEPYFGSGSIFL